ncbi:DUF3306 domain-containing protein [Vibrio sp. V38_P2S17PM301]|nr:DUF3306 domain-containing protein [Vibrio sp. V36_P2S2PM302]NAX26349.1 DUF3306 domain-containing protein [Vibrio sp. V38_P2S17PM301]NAX32062.1 DUF3306 domain-containing protein [Vibrio sp. V37_P2S8PM304]
MASYSKLVVRNEKARGVLVATDNNPFFSRWSRRKLDPQSQAADEHGVNQTEVTENASDVPVMEQVPDDSPDKDPQETRDLSVAELLVSGATAATKKAALRKLFLSGEFSEVDRLNDYDHDYSAVKPLSTDVAEKLREWLNEHEEEPPHKVAEERISTKVEKEEAAELHSDLSSIQTQHNQDVSDEEVGQNIPHKS